MLWLISVVILLILLELFAILLKFSPTRSKLKFIKDNGMSFARIYSRAQVAMNAPLISIEVHITTGLPKFSIVGFFLNLHSISKNIIINVLISNILYCFFVIGKL